LTSSSEYSQWIERCNLPGQTNDANVAARTPGKIIREDSRFKNRAIASVRDRELSTSLCEIFIRENFSDAGLHQIRLQLAD
jgi:hypothetical protein